jgi:CubicO group peptidase (beta-lactamase class C family)
MKKAIILILSTALIYGCGSSNDADRQDALPLATHVIDTAISEGELHFAVAAVGNTSGQLWSHSAGHRDAQKTSVAANDNIIQIASMTKLITTIGALQLVEQGVLDLDTPITAYVPQLSELQVLEGFDEQDNPILENADRAPTVRELMTHTGGYVYEFWNANAKKASELGVSESLFSGGNYLAAPLAFEAGTAWEYGINTDWLGVIIERISGQRLSVYFDENIFGPLRMVDTFYELPQEKMNRSVTVMARVNDALIELPTLQPAPMAKGSMAHYSGGGGLYSTVADYGRVLQMLLSEGALDGETLLNPETVDAMFANNIGDIQLAALGTVMPEVSNTADMTFGNPATFGLGLLLHSEGIEGGRKAYSGSWAGLFNSYYWVDRESKTYGIFGTQILPFFDAASVDTLLKLEQAVYAQPAK